MSLRQRTLLFSGVTLLILVALLFLISSSILLDSFETLETRDVQENLVRVQNALNDELVRLSSISGDWAPWTDTYNFVLGQNDAYIADNLMDSTFANLEINLMAFVNKGDIMKWAVPNHYIFVEELAKTTVGKIDKKTLRNHYQTLPD